MKPSLLVASILIIGTLTYFFANNGNPKHLEPPLLKSPNELYGTSMTLTGTGYPNAKVLVYVNEEYFDNIVIDNNGSFSKNLSLDNEGIFKIKISQTYKGVTSGFDKEYSVSVDITPPEDKLFKLSTEIPSITTQKVLQLTGTGSPNDHLILNGEKYLINSSGKFEINYTLQEGENHLEFKMSDRVGNVTGTLEDRFVAVDTVPPTISNIFPTISKGPTEESVVVDIGGWSGYLDAFNSIAITGSVEGNVKRITIDGKNVYWDENNKIYQRLNLYVYGGLNKYKVVAEDTAGNISTGYVQTTAEKDQQEVNLNLNQ